MVFPLYFWLLFAAAMLVSSIGFKNYVWFISLGYGFSIAAEGLLMLILYRIVRCPNYLGEMIFWTGALLSGIGAVSGIGQWIMVLLGYAGIIFVMFSGARRLEIRQNKNYGSDPEYQHYVKTVPILLPFVPLYSVEKHKVLVA